MRRNTVVAAIAALCLIGIAVYLVHGLAGRPHKVAFRHRPRETPGIQHFYTGTIDRFPEPAQAVLSYQPANSKDSISERVVAVCGLGAGSKAIPGSVMVQSLPEGWSRVSWTLHCPSGQVFSSHDPTLMFSIWQDRTHIREDNDAARRWLKFQTRSPLSTA